LFFGLINEHKKRIWREMWERWDARDTCAEVKKTKNWEIKRKTQAQCNSSTKRAGI